MIKVFKFGGASVRNAAAVRNLGNILKQFSGNPLLVVVSAMGKTTNALEALLVSAQENRKDTKDLLNRLQSYHDDIINDLFPTINENFRISLQSFYKQLEISISQVNVNDYDCWYDEVVSTGELISTLIVAEWIKAQGIRVQWLDARDYVITDDQYRSANVDWSATCRQVSEIHEKFNQSEVMIVQGFIGRSVSGKTTTLGREGSDYSASIFAYCLDAMDVTIWKDVPGLLNADPKRVNDTVKLEAISYSEAIELSFYGATVIHPKTIKPLQNKNIPLYVKSFVDFNETASLIGNDHTSDSMVPSYIFKDNQLLISLSPRDFSFMDEGRLETVFGILAREHIHSNVLQTSALSLSICIDQRPGLPEKLMQLFGEVFFIKYNHGLTLLTIRHFDESRLARFISGKKVFLEQRSRTTLQFVLGELS